MGVVTDEYFDYQTRYEQKFGPFTVVLYQVGSFYEIYTYSPYYHDQYVDYDFINNINGSEIGHAITLCKVINMQLTSKNKREKHSKTNPFLIGFPCVSYEKNREPILSNGYTIVRIDQKTNGKTVERHVVEISSPATDLLSDLCQQTNGNRNILCIYLEFIGKQPWYKKSVVCGLAIVDVSTGKVSVCEVYSKQHDELYLYQELYRYLSIIQPIEIVVYIDYQQEFNEQEVSDTLYKRLNLQAYKSVQILYNKCLKEYGQLVYQAQFLSKVYGSKEMYSNPNRVISNLDLERLDTGRVALVSLLQFCYEHNELLINRLQPPSTSWVDDSSYLILTHNAIQQLNLVDRKKTKGYNSCFDVVNKTYTRMGSSLLCERLCNPKTNEEWMQNQYNMIQYIIDKKIAESLTKELNCMPDIEKYHRKCQVNELKPKELLALVMAYQRCITLYSIVNEHEVFKPLTSIMTQEDINEFNNCYQVCKKYICVEGIQSLPYEFKNKGLDTDKQVFYQGLYTELDSIYRELETVRNALVQILDTINQHVPCGKTQACTLSEVDDDTYRLCINATRVKHFNKGLDIPQIGKLQIVKDDKKTIVCNQNVIDLCETYSNLRKKYQDKLLVAYCSFCCWIGKQDYIYSLNKFVAELDVLQSSARVAIKYKYYKPSIIDDSKSYMEIKDLRHPLIERIISQEYIPNDVTLDSDTIGLLLYGVNSTGKSSLAKAIGLCIIFAQAGLFVPAQLRFKPYSKIITRLSGHDDLLTGQSSFIVEMSELRTIIKSADSSTLVLGDELCRGTETVSGTSLTVATIHELLKRKCNFVFSTHMHHLPNIKTIHDPRIRIAHLETYYDDTLEKLVYNRKLSEGTGSSLYGIEVCRSLGFDTEFISEANRIRKEIEQRPELFLTTKHSRYNANVFLHECYNCGKSQDLHTHHIKEQHMADNDGFINTFHKDSRFNLVVLCQECHNNLHKNKKTLEVVQTLDSYHIVDQ